MHRTIKKTLILSAVIAVISFLLFSLYDAISYSDDSPRSGPESLLAKYHEIEKELGENPAPVSFHIESSVNKKSSNVDIYGTIKYPFDIVQKELLVPTNWSRIVLPNPNVRACTYRKVNDVWQLNIYRVNKFTESIEDAHKMIFEYQVSKLQPEYFNIDLIARKGPYHTKDHKFALEAIPVERDITFIRLNYSFSYSALGYFLIKMLGGSAIGFSTTGTDGAGDLVYVKGLRGSVERDIVCHYLSLLTYFDTVETPFDQQFERQIDQWYDLTTDFKKQFYEMTKGEYIKFKSQDWEIQQRLQGDLEHEGQ